MPSRIYGLSKSNKDLNMPFKINEQSKNIKFKKYISNLVEPQK